MLAGRRAALLAGSAAMVITACGAATATSSSSPPAAGAAYRGGTFAPPRAEPPLVLNDYLGHPFDLVQTHGKVVLVTFLYTHCPDVCPLIATSLREVQAQLGAAAQGVVLVAISTDPVGDTSAAVASFLAARSLAGGRMVYLLDTPAQLRTVEAQWMLTAAPDASSPSAIDHTALVYGIGASGKLVTVYPANFKPADLAHDVPLLAAA